MANHEEKIYSILLEIKEENGKQTSKIESIDKKQDTLTEYQREANHSMSKVMTRVQNLENETKDLPELKKNLSDVMTTKKAILILCSAIPIIGGLVWGISKYALDAYVYKQFSSFLTDSGYDSIIIKNK